MNIKTILTAFAVIFLCGCVGNEEKNDDPRTVRVIRPYHGENKIDKHFSGVVAESREISLGFKTAGQLEKIYVKEGDYVRKGALLASLDVSDYEIGAEGLRAQAAQLKSELERCRKLYEQKSMSLNDFEKIKAGYAQLESQLKGIENKIAYTKLYSPVSGHIQSVNFSKAEMVDAGTPVFSLLDDDNMEIVVDIPISVYREIDKVKEVRIKMPSSGNEVPLQILSVVTKADGNQLFKMKLELPSKYDAEFTPGMNVDVEITVNSGMVGNDYVSIPAHTIFHEGDATFVWVLGNDSTLQKRKVYVGAMTPDGLISVSEGLDGSETIVNSGVNMLREGEKVKVLEKPAKSNVGGLL